MANLKKSLVFALCLLQCVACTPTHNPPSTAATAPAVTHQNIPYPKPDPLTDAEAKRMYQLSDPKPVTNALSLYVPPVTDPKFLSVAQDYFYVSQGKLIDKKCNFLTLPEQQLFASNLQAMQMITVDFFECQAPTSSAPNIGMRITQGLSAGAIVDIQGKQYYQCGTDAKLIVKYSIFEAERMKNLLVGAFAGTLK